MISIRDIDERRAGRRRRLVFRPDLVAGRGRERTAHEHQRATGLRDEIGEIAAEFGLAADVGIGTPAPAAPRRAERLIRQRVEDEAVALRLTRLEAEARDGILSCRIDAMR